MLTRRFLYVGKQIQRRNPEVLVPVPLHPARQRKRGYNQAGGICRKAGRRNGTSRECPPDPPCRKNKTPERAWSRRAAENPEGAFALAKPGQMKYCRILLVDDIYTTGSTVDAIASLLKVRWSRTGGFCLCGNCKIVCEYFENSFQYRKHMVK